MGKLPDRGTQRADIFLDLENLGMVGRSLHFNNVVAWLLHGLHDRLPRYRLELGSIWAAAFTRNDKHAPLREHRKALHEMFRTYNGTLHWSKTDADSTIIRQVEWRLEQGKLAPVMILVSNDADFAPMVSKVRAAGIHTIIVHASPFGSPTLEQSADRSYKIVDFLGTRPPSHPYRS